ncbi:hypothetical protein GQ53DRAFT_669948 [Thozetella sp. PMI_491]|nr:hypothetical protein GQ53DRAFT_669948 [Thozetella sp. PMI_491]
MEQQADDLTKDSRAPLGATSQNPTRPRTPPSASVPSLRFPRPQGNRHLANWISNSSPDIMPPSTLSDAGSLTDSAYELINSTDGEVESQDGRMAESIGSLSVSRPEDVHSLDGSEDTYESSDDEEADDHSSSDISIKYADASLRNPSSHPSIHSLPFGASTEAPTPLIQSIEFKEAEAHGESPIIEKVCVKHTVREFNEEESAAIAKDLGMPEIPKRMIATIRQTMSQHCLSTTEPLRVLYVGSPAGQKDIIYKLSSAIWASGTADAEKVAYRNTEGVYNIVPISSFGSAKEPEIQLMETSGYQIKVEHCTFAEEIIYEGQFFPSDTVYSLTIDGDRVYRSLYNPSGSVIQPRWSLPHIAIFYLTGNDDAEAEHTRSTAWKFMKRHGVPSIFISHSQALTKPSTGDWSGYVDQHAIHMCLESRDPDVPSIAQRVPIDLASFINIDARQMNRNLSYLTGLIDPEEPSQEKSIAQKLSRPDLWKSWQPSQLGPEEVTCIRISLAVLVAVVSLAFSPTLFAWMRRDVSLPPPGPTITVLPVAALSTLQPTTSTRAVTTSTSTVVINVTSTKTVKISKVEPTASSLASVLSFAGFLSDKPSSAPPEAETKKVHCSVEVYSPSEILVKLPERTLWSFLAKDAIKIGVFRGEESIKWQRLSSVDEGLLLDIGKDNAYGVLNVSIVTTRKPKINETFEVNFGKPIVAEVLAAGMHMLQDIAHKVASTADEAAHLVEDTCRPAASAGMERLREDAASIFNNLVTAGKAASHNAQDRLTQHFKSAETLRDDVGMSLLKAQVASKLWWLKVQGKYSEHSEYERKATQFLKAKQAEIAKTQKLRLTEDCGLPGTSKHRQCQKNLESRAKVKDSSRWKKMIIG